MLLETRAPAIGGLGACRHFRLGELELLKMCRWARLVDVLSRFATKAWSRLAGELGKAICWRGWQLGSTSLRLGLAFLLHGLVHGTPILFFSLVVAAIFFLKQGF